MTQPLVVPETGVARMFSVQCHRCDVYTLERDCFNCGQHLGDEYLKRDLEVKGEPSGTAA